MSKRKWIFDIVMVILGGALLFLSLPKPEIPLLAWVSLVPLLFAISGKKPSHAALLGFLFGLTAYIGIFYWTSYPIAMYGGIPVFLAITFMFLLVMYISLYPTVFAYFVVWSKERFSLSEFVSVPIAWTTLEYLREFILTGFPWGYLGHSQLPWLNLMQILDITGVYGVSFVIASVNACIFLIILRIVKKRQNFPVAETLISVLLVATLIIYGLYAMRREDKIVKSIAPITVALIQGNIRQDLKWDPSYQEETVHIYETLSIASIDYSSDIVIWPETATPFFFDLDDTYRPRILELPRKLNAYLLFGTPAYEMGEDDYIFFNRSYVLSPRGEIIGRYDKIHLVPFGEYIPYKKILFFVDKFVYSVGDMRSGTITEPIETNVGSIGTLICYEAIFPEISRIFARNGASLLVNITNDAWFGETSAPYQHFSMARMRAIETRLPLVRAANTGITAIIKPTGEAELVSTIFTRSVIVGDINPNNRTTFYTRFGDIFAQIVTALFFFLIVVHLYSIIRLKLKRSAVERKKK